MISTKLADGRIKHITEGWTGFQNPDESMTKTKWYRDDMKYWEVEGSNTTYVVTQDKLGTMNCQCTGFRFRKYCKHVNEIKKENK